MRRFARWFCLCVFSSFAAPVIFAQGGAAPAAAPSQADSSAKKPAAPTAAHPGAAHKGIDPGLLQPATLKAKAPDVYEVKFATTKGDFVITVTRAWAPLGADRFYNLVKHGFYNEATFFRVVPGFVVQFGLGPNPAVNKAWANANIKDDPVTQSNKPGYVTYAKSSLPNSRTTQVFISFGDNSFLDKDGFAPFGQVTSGMEVVQSLYGGYADAPTSHQEEITNGGKAYLEKSFPKLDSIKSATVISPAPAPAAKKPAGASSAPKP